MEKIFYRVEENDTLLKISQKFNIAYTKIIEENNLKKEVEAGDLLYMEKEYDDYMVNVYDTIESIAIKFNIKKEEIIKNNHTDYVFYGMVIIV